MNPENEMIPGLRRPTPREQAWIAEHWGYEIQKKTHRTNGKILRFVAIFLIAVGVAGSVRGGENLVGSVICLIVGLVCYGSSRAIGKDAGKKDRRLLALATGDYYVAQATSVKIGYTLYQKYRDGSSEVRLSDGRILERNYKMPYRLAKPLIDRNINCIPILLIQLPGEHRILTIPVQH